MRNLTAKMIRHFQRTKSAILRMDELNLLDYSRSLYDTLYKEAFSSFYRIANYYYSDITGKKYKKEWLLLDLAAFDLLEKYVFDNEVERKRSRFFESAMSSKKRAKEAETAMRLWHRMIAQWSISITDKAMRKAYEDTGVKKVMWMTENDGRCCSTCEERHKKLYSLKSVPEKPHINCRCWLVPVKE